MHKSGYLRGLMRDVLDAIEDMPVEAFIEQEEKSVLEGHTLFWLLDQLEGCTDCLPSEYQDHHILEGEGISYGDAVRGIREELKVRHAGLWLSYFKQGDDMCGCLKDTNDDLVAALERHADRMLGVSEHLRETAKFIRESGQELEFDIDADTHMINIGGPAELIEEMVKRELLSRLSYESASSEEVVIEADGEVDDN